jgi:type 1 glutamine amidotransferase
LSEIILIFVVQRYDFFGYGMVWTCGFQIFYLSLLSKLKVMRKLFGLFLCVCLLFGFQSCNRDAPVRVLLITGGHDFDRENFEILLSRLPIVYTHVEHPYAHAMLRADKIAPYDVVLLYDMPRYISEEAQQDFIAMLERGIGLVVLHHAFCSYDFWPEYTKIVGGRYHHYPWTKNGVEQPPSTFTYGVTMQIRVEDRNHPVTKGITDFEIFDEAYGGTEILPTVHPLLSTDSEYSAPLVAWTNEYGNSRIVTLTLGHDRRAWENPSFIQVLSQAILWVK